MAWKVVPKNCMMHSFCIHMLFLEGSLKGLGSQLVSLASLHLKLRGQERRMGSLEQNSFEMNFVRFSRCLCVSACQIFVNVQTGVNLDSFGVFVLRMQI